MVYQPILLCPHAVFEHPVSFQRVSTHAHLEGNQGVHILAVSDSEQLRLVDHEAGDSVIPFHVPNSCYLGLELTVLVSLQSFGPRLDGSKDVWE